MLVLKENQKLYLTTWGYNMCRIMTKLAKIVVENGGRVKPQKKAVVVNRSISEMKKECIERINHYKSIESKKHYDLLSAAIEKKEKDLKELEQIKSEPIQVTHTSYISFIYENNYYYYQMDENPFFEFYYTKTPIKDNKHSCDTLSTESKKVWLYDCFLRVGECTESDIKKAAEYIFNTLVKSKCSDIRLDKKRVRVHNSYNNSYHYETIYEKERFASVDF